MAEGGQHRFGDRVPQPTKDGEDGVPVLLPVMERPVRMGGAVQDTQEGGSWLNMVESFTSVKDLMPPSGAFVDSWNNRCQPFTWTKDADTILAKVNDHPRLKTAPLGDTRRVSWGSRYSETTSMSGKELRTVSRVIGPAESGVYLDCMASSYAFQLVEHGLDARVLGDEWWYWYTEDDTQRDAWPASIFSVARRTPGEIIRQWYGIEEHELTHDTAADVWSYARFVTGEGRSVAVHLDPYHWPPASLFAGQLHGTRRVVLADIDSTGAQVLDGFGEGQFSGRVEREVILGAIAGLAEGSCITVDLPPPAAIREPSRNDVVQALRSGWCSPASMGDHPADGYPKIWVGGSAARAFADDVRNRAASGQPLPISETATLFSSLGTAASQRQLGAMFVELAAEHIPALKLSADEFASTARRWFVLYNMFLFGVMLKRPIQNVLTGMADRVELVVRAEEEALESLFDTFDSAQ